MKKKSTLVGEILELTNQPSEKYFDRLIDKPVAYLEKLLNIIKNWK